MPTAAEIITRLELRPHPEGGYYRETYRSADVLPAAALPGRYRTDKAAATAIYYLLTRDTFSALHRLPTDEVYHFYAGSPVCAPSRSALIRLPRWPGASPPGCGFGFGSPLWEARQLRL